jgi:methionine-rich copper-binding protein CopC
VKRAALGSVLLALGILVAGPVSLAFAHADLVQSTPDDGAVLASVPEQVELTFSEDLLPETVVVSVEDSAGMVIRVLELEVDGSDVIVAWPPGLSGTDYTVNYRVVSQDGHPVSGSLAFVIDDPSASAASSVVTPPAAAEAAAGDEGPNATAYAAIAAGLGVGIAIGFLFLVTRRRRGTGAPDAPTPGSSS